MIGISVGIIKQLPLELWVCGTVADSPYFTPDTHYMSALLCGIETMLSGGTSIMDHLPPIPGKELVRLTRVLLQQLDIRTRAIVRADRSRWCRSASRPCVARTPTLASVLSSDRCCVRYSHSRLLAHSPTHCAGLLVDLEALDTIAKEPIREPSSIPPAQPHQAVPIAGATAHALDVLERAAKQFHRPESGVWIVAGASGLHSSSDELIIGCRDISNKYNLPRHLHVLETRNQQQVAWDKYGESAGTATAPCLRRIASRRARKSLTLCARARDAVAHLARLDYLDHKTSCAHAIHLTDDDIRIMAEKGATAVHNPLSNLRLGSGIAPVLKYIDAGVNVAFGCDGSASNDSQDLLEAIKMGTILHNITDRDYRKWITPTKVHSLPLVLALVLETNSCYRPSRWRHKEEREQWASATSTARSQSDSRPIWCSTTLTT